MLTIVRLAIVGAVGGATGVGIGALLEKDAKFQEEVTISYYWHAMRSQLYTNYGRVLL